MAAEVRSGEVRFVQVGLVGAAKECSGGARLITLRRGEADMVCRGRVRHGESRRGAAAKVRYGEAG